MTNALMFQAFIDRTDKALGTDSNADGSIGLFHILAAALDWCDMRGVDFDLTLQEVREQLAAEG